MKSLSCGILVLNARGELLLCHATGTLVWDIPKGGAEPGETPLAAAIRETAEETGLRFAAGDLHELGRFDYRPSKDLHLYATLAERIDPRMLNCESRFRDVWGRLRPEMDAYAWTAFDRIHRRCARRMRELLTERLSLHALLEQLQQRTQQPPRRAAPSRRGVG